MSNFPDFTLLHQITSDFVSIASEIALVKTIRLNLIFEFLTFELSFLER